MDDSAAPPRRVPAPVLALPGLALLGVWYWVTASTGRLDAAFGDGWSYLRVAFRFADTGSFDLNGYVSTSFFGQAVLASPVLRAFPDSITAAQTWTAVVTACGVVALASLARRHLGPGATAFAVAVLAAGPVVAMLTGSFFADLPAFAAQMVCLAVGAAAVDRRSVPWLATSLAAGFVAFTIRDFAIVAPVAVLVTVVVAAAHGAPRFSRRVAIGAVLAFSAGVLVFTAWRQSLPNVEPFPIDASYTGLWKWIPRAAVSLGAMVAPAAFVVSPLGLWRGMSRPARLVAGLVIAAGAVLAVAAATERATLMGDLLGSAAHYGIGGGPTAPVLRGIAVAGAYGVTVLGLAAIALVDGLRWRALVRERPDRLVLAIATVFGFAPLVAYIVFSETVPPFDRYLLPVLPGCVVALLSARRVLLDRGVTPRQTATEVLGAVGLVALAAVSGWILVDTGRPTGQAWAAGRRVVARGVPATKVNGPGEWNPFYGPYVTGPAHLGRDWRLRLTQGRCAIVTFGEVPRGWIEIERRTVERFDGRTRPLVSAVEPGSECERVVSSRRSRPAGPLRP